MRGVRIALRLFSVLLTRMAFVRGAAQTPWLGVYDFSNRSAAPAWMYWSSRLPVSGASEQWHPWISGEPSGDDERCVQYYLHVSDRWASTPCSSRSGYICQVSESLETVQPVGCGAGYYMQSDGRCYRAVVNSRETWRDAASVCAEENTQVRACERPKAERRSVPSHA